MAKLIPMWVLLLLGVVVALSLTTLLDSVHAELETTDHGYYKPKPPPKYKPPYKKPPPKYKPPVVQPPPEHKPPVEKPPPKHNPPYYKKPPVNPEESLAGHKPPAVVKPAPKPEPPAVVKPAPKPKPPAVQKPH